MKTETTTDIQAALLSASGSVVKLGGKRYKLYCHMMVDYMGIERFHCDAKDLNPRTDEERKFCFCDLWKSDTAHSSALLFKFAKLGGYDSPKTF